MEKEYGLKRKTTNEKIRRTTQSTRVKRNNRF